MTARRGKSQARRNDGNGLPGWAWLLIGVVLTLLAVLLVPRYLKSGSHHDFFRPTPNPDALPPPVSSDSEAIVPDTAPTNTKPAAGKSGPSTRYDFYTLLPGQEVAISDAQLAADTRAEQDAAAARRESQTQPAERAATSPAPTAPPSPPATDTSATAPTDAHHASPAQTDPTSAKATTATNAGADARYLLQAGAFAASGDAEALKARIALLGLSARVESTQIDGNTLYRVRMGPFGSASELSEAKAKLAEGGVSAIAVKRQ
jgi:cell division protein FtsN